jgi:hypothetical protein
MEIEHYVDVNVAAAFLSVKPRYLLELTRTGKIPGHRLSNGSRRNIWRFRLSELEKVLSSSVVSFTAPLERRTTRGRQSHKAENGR